jgi:PAS domain S-box-containing protein
MNELAEKLTGWREHESLGRPLNEVFVLHDEKSNARISIAVRKVLLEYGVGKGFTDVMLCGKSGCQMPISYIVSPIRSAEFFAGMIIVFRDNTERHKAEGALEQTNADLATANAALKQRNTDLEQFAYAASHDLREPLRTIGVVSELLAKSVPKNQETQKLEAFVRSGVRQMEALIDGLLAYARATVPAETPNDPVSMQVVLENAVSNLQAAIDASGARITSTALPVVRGSEAQFTQVLQNLIGNAIKYRGPQSPELRLSAERENGSYVFHVRDNGIGFDSKHAPQLFGLFKRLHTNAKYPGTGIGLALCKRIIEMHGGRIWAESELGKGSTFSFTLQAEDEQLSRSRHGAQVEASVEKSAAGHRLPEPQMRSTHH